ncbi:hypothetical protein A4A49_26459 [Nicotiana attenuata]|uniref:Uncharacterized protein n=1 Tax=Nicotiana attenuata TaxID=49451 RepID=A0A1J6IPB2_NICAT|nr:hypothetical protein A4A49_26459 [Nicotiana attenuata]
MAITNRCILLLLLSISISFLASEARPVDVLKVQGSGFVGSGGAFNWLNLGAVKNGLNLGIGHKFTNSQMYLGINNSGPSPGEGHKVTTANHQ